jgi:hypothetical protein
VKPQLDGAAAQVQARRSAALPLVGADVADRVETAQRRDRLGRLAGPKQLRATVLALLATSGSARQMGVLREECADAPALATLLADIQALSVGERLPWLERLVGVIAKSPIDERRLLLRSARRVMGADGRTSASDRLRWLGLRHALGDRKGLVEPGAAQSELEQLGEQMVHWIGRWSAFLSRLVPLPEPQGDANADAVPPGALWWRAVMAPWPEADTKRVLPDADTLVNALHGIQTLPWMLRPVLVRRWIDAAIVLSPASGLHPAAAEALRIAAGLLDTPPPPELNSSFVECSDA